MKRVWIALAAIAMIAALPASAAAHSNKRPAVKNAAKYCKAQRAQMGAEAFRAAYGGKRNALGKCVKKRVHDQRALRRGAVKQCRTELGVAKRFRHSVGEPGDGKPPKEAFRKCIEQKSHEQDQNNQEDFLTAVRDCLTEHDADPAAFNGNYGEGDSEREAFVSCVREHFQQNSDDNEGETETPDEPGPPTDGTETPPDGTHI
jgi:hypothetical protein